MAALKGGFELIRSLADLSERVYHSDDRKRVRMSTLTEDAGGVDVRDNSDHLVGAIATAEDDDENFNEVYVTGPSYRGDATREHLPTETDQRIFVLSRPIFAMLQPNAGNSETAGLTDSGADWTYDQGGTVLTRGAGGSFTGTSLTVDYYPIEFIAEVERDTQDIQRRGRSPLPLSNSARTKEEARSMAKAELARYRILRNSITFRTNNLTFRAGQNIAVGKASPPALSGQYVVTKAEYMDRSGNGYMEGTVTASSRVDHDAYEEMFGEGRGVSDLTVEMDQGFPRVEIPVTVTEAAPLGSQRHGPVGDDQRNPGRQRGHYHGAGPYAFGRDIRRRPRLFVDRGSWQPVGRRYSNPVLDKAGGYSRDGLRNHLHRDGNRCRDKCFFGIDGGKNRDHDDDRPGRRRGRGAVGGHQRDPGRSRRDDRHAVGDAGGRSVRRPELRVDRRGRFPERRSQRDTGLDEAPGDGTHRLRRRPDGYGPRDRLRPRPPERATTGPPRP